MPWIRLATVLTCFSSYCKQGAALACKEKAAAVLLAIEFHQPTDDTRMRGKSGKKFAFHDNPF